MESKSETKAEHVFSDARNVAKETFEVNDKDWNEDDSPTRCDKRNVVECGLLQIGVVFMMFCVITTAVALMVYFIPGRSDIAGTKLPVSKHPTTYNILTSHSQPTQPSTTIPGHDSTTDKLQTEPTADPLLIGRLPRTVLPRRYLLNIRPYLYDDDALYSTLNRTSTFDGWVRIEVECMEPTDEIILHSDTLTLHGSPNVTGSDTGDPRDLLDYFTLDNELLFLVLKLKEKLKPNKHYEIGIAFSGLMQDSSLGFYVSEYYNSENELRLTAGTQMEGAYARRVLPCFDEPAFKASFDVQIEHRQNMTALSNGMETDTIQLDNHWARSYFKRVGAMSTYLLAIAVHDFKNITATTEDGCLIRIWMQPDYISDASIALEDAMKLQTFFNSFLDMKYPLEKLDHIGITLMEGAMENWGLVIYDEGLLKDNDVLTITHEVAHQWFGNLVTPEWWDDLWLNEGFATYLQHIGIDYLDPSQQAYEQFYGNTMSSALSFDIRFLVVAALKAPVSYDVVDIQNQLVSFTYSKGGSIIFMMKHLLADGIFEKGIRNYLRERAYKNANIDHLWEELTYADQDVGKHDMKKIMDSWTLQAGAPIVTFNRTGNSIVAKQERFYTGFPNPPELFSDRYFIPLSYVHQTDPKNPKKLIMEPENEETIINLDDASEADWYLANYMQTGYYYANYDQQNWQRIVDQANKDPTVFTYQNQIGLMHQTRELRTANMISPDIYYSLIDAFRNTTRGTREAALEADMNELIMLGGQRSRDVIERRIREELDNLYVEMGWSEDNIVDPLNSRRITAKHRLDITSLACFYGNRDCVSRATKLFKDIMENPLTNSVKTVFRSLVYCNGIRYGGLAEWDFAWKQMQDTRDFRETTRWGMALTCSVNSSALIGYTETLGVSSSDLDVLKVITALALNPIGQDLAWSYVRNNWDRLHSSDTFNIHAGSDLLSAVGASFNTADKFQELLDFGNGRDFGPLRFAYDIAVTQASRNAFGRANYAED